MARPVVPKRKTIFGKLFPSSIALVSARCRALASSPALEVLEERRMLALDTAVNAGYTLSELLNAGTANQGVIERSMLPALAMPSTNFTILPSATGTFDIQLEKSPALLANAAASAAFDKAAAFYESIFFDPVTIIVDADFDVLPTGVIGQTSASPVSLGVDQLRTLMVADAGSDESIVSQLPTQAQLQTTFPSDLLNPWSLSGAVANRAEMKALGVPESQLPGDASKFNPSVKADMSVKFSSTFNFDFDPSDGISPGLIDFVGVAIHEIGHGLGFESSVDEVDALMQNPLGTHTVPISPLDMFRLEPGAGAANFTTAPRIMAPGGNPVFYDGGIYNPSAFNNFPGLTMGDIPVSTGTVNGDKWQASHWKNDDITGVTIGIMDPTTGDGQLDVFTDQDKRAFGLLGYDLTPVAPPLPSVSLSGDVSHLEGDSGFVQYVYNVTVSGELTVPIVVNYNTTPGTATPFEDYIPAFGPLVFVPGGPTTQSFTVLAIGDTKVEPNETFVVHISTDETAASLGTNQALGTILNDDADISINDVIVVEGDSGTKSAVFTVAVVGDTNRPVSYNYTTLNGTAQGGADYLARAGAVTLAPGADPVQITVPIVGDTLSESTENFLVLLTNVQGARLAKGIGIGTILDNDPAPSLYVNDVRVTTISAGVYAAVFTIALNTASGQDVSVAFHTTDGSALAGIDYDQQNGVITIPAGAISAQVSVPVFTSDLYAPNKKFTLDLSSPVHANLGDAQGVATIIFAEGPVGEYIIDNGAVGFSQTTGWTNLTNTYGYDLDYQHHAAGNGSGAATWTFAGVGAGTFEVFARWVPFVNWASNAPYTILDGTTPLATVRVNQKIAPVGDQSNGVIWQSLGTFQANSGTLAVRLNDDANGYVVADAIRIVVNGIPAQTPEMDVAGADHSIATGDNTPSVGDATEYDAVQANWGSETHTFTIGNNGNADLHLTGGPSVAISGANASDFSITALPATTISPGGTTTFQVLFHPTGVGLRTATISVANDDPDEGPYTFTVEGTGFGSGQTSLLIDDSSLGFSKVGGWATTANAQAQAGAFLVSDAGTGSDQATWDFTNLALGTYDVYASWVPFANRATNAPFVVSNLDGNSFGVPVNEQLAPTVEVNSALWGNLGSIDVTNGRLRVTLSDNADGFVAADSVLVVRRDTQANPLAAVHNMALPADVNGDSKVTSRDLLMVINTLVAKDAVAVGLTATPLTAVAQTTVQNWYVDVNGDGAVTPRDALAVINYLLAQPVAAPQAEPEVAPQAAPQAASNGLLLAAIDRALSTDLEDDTNPFESWS